MHGYLGFHGTDGPRTRARDAARARHAARAGARRRALLAGAVAAAVALQGGWQDQGTGAGSAEAPPPVPGQGNAAAGRMDAPGRLRAAVEREAARLREALDAAEAGQDLRSLARRRLTVDAVLVPLHLVRDAMETTTNLAISHGVMNMNAKDHLGLDQRARVMVEIKDGKWKLQN
jgi:hypothetical protein